MMQLKPNFVSGVVLTKVEHQFKMLLLKRADEGYWCHVAGKIEKSETAWQAFLRELKEETQLCATRLYNADYLQQFYYPRTDQIFIAIGFVVYCDPEIKVTLNNEHTDYRWCSLEEALQLAPHPNQRKFYQHVWQYFVTQSSTSQLCIKTNNV
ncbi:NUDIX domain-containing protein [Photobacterium sp. ZSDE20]|uniref:NUDIX domain-containing protein n=1 Tax=Photobacterium pectinilyticum TaxID=2906793 RepID=A0ABT1MX23_9GAMM|nr:NUDIX domain-containing protein [Photobacterium sp. ZSDE20]MCQ1056914.1 NUDIX domain-containing protein [Photobacterium sp. ZSDE20]MDD1821049.1 NUDIX domain-containing protein [Photobacterium sp. ZSDE20]